MKPRVGIFACVIAFAIAAWLALTGARPSAADEKPPAAPALVGRYQIFQREELYLLDTTTGKVWKYDGKDAWVEWIQPPKK